MAMGLWRIMGNYMAILSKVPQAITALKRAIECTGAALANLTSIKAISLSLLEDKSCNERPLVRLDVSDTFRLSRVNKFLFSLLLFTRAKYEAEIDMRYLIQNIAHKRSQSLNFTTHVNKRQRSLDAAHRERLSREITDGC
ncbi:hypothetical protein F4801DRAFT_574958 [Xylaria longipes]|nr:hypothetical protein F4801DRAFT_574958 [Xylaria longipes]